MSCRVPPPNETPYSRANTAASTGVDRLSGVYERRWIDNEAAWAASFTRVVPRRLYRPRAQLRCEILGLEVEVIEASRTGARGTGSTAETDTAGAATAPAANDDDMGNGDNGFRGGPFEVTLDFLPRIDPHILNDPQLQLQSALAAASKAAAAAASAAAAGGGGGGGGGVNAEEDDNSNSLTLDGEIRFGTLQLRGQGVTMQGAINAQRRAESNLVQIAADVQRLSSEVGTRGSVATCARAHAFLPRLL